MIRRLDTKSDESLLRETYSWDEGTPEWYRDMSRVFGPDDVEDFLKMAEKNILVGIFDPEFIGLLILESTLPHCFEAHLCARRGARLGVLIEGTARVINDFLNMGMREGFCWVASKNSAIKKLCEQIGMAHDGIVMYRGVYRGKLIKWQRYSVIPLAQEIEVAA